MIKLRIKAKELREIDLFCRFLRLRGFFPLDKKPVPRITRDCLYTLFVNLEDPLKCSDVEKAQAWSNLIARCENLDPKKAVRTRRGRKSKHKKLAQAVADNSQN